MKKLNIAFAALLALVFALSALFPPQAEAVADAQNGRLVGYLASYEHLDLTELDVSVMGEVRVKNGRLYAALDDHGEPVFEGVEGVMVACLVIGEGEESYTAVSQSGALFDTSMSVHSSTDADGENSEHTELSAELRVYPDGAPEKTRHYFMNPIYQLPDGRVYLTAGTGIGTSSDIGGAVTMRNSETDTVVLHGKKTAYSIELSITIRVCAKPEKLVFVCMDGNNTPLCSDEFAQDALPESYAPASGTAWVAAILYAEGAEPEYQVLTNADKGKSFTAQHAENGAILPHNIDILWPEA